MTHAYKIGLILYLALVLSVPVLALEPSMPSVGVILDRFEESLSWIDCVAAVVDITPTLSEEGMPLYKTRLVLRHDKERAEWLSKVTFFDSSGNPDLAASYEKKVYILDGRCINVKNFLGLPPVQAALWDRNVASTLKKNQAHADYGGPLAGWAPGNEQKNVAKLLRMAGKVSLRQVTEEVCGSQCYVLDAVTPYGRVLAWVAADKGYIGLKWSIHKSASDLYNKKLLKENWDKSIDYLRVIFECSSVQEVGNVFLPKDCSFAVLPESKGKLVNATRDVYTMQTAQLNPDFDSLGAFVVDMPNGTPVHGQNTPRCRYEWYDGKLILVWKSM